eukprot:5473909-Amphidinium_carterae.2
MRSCGKLRHYLTQAIPPFGRAHNKSQEGQRLQMDSTVVNSMHLSPEACFEVWSLASLPQFVQLCGFDKFALKEFGGGCQNKLLVHALGTSRSSCISRFSMACLSNAGKVTDNVLILSRSALASAISESSWAATTNPIT